MLEPNDAEYLAAATVGGLVGFAMRHPQGASRGAYIVAAVSAILVGYVTIKLGRHFALDEDVIGASCGIFGWLGAENAMGILQRFLPRPMAIGDKKE